MNKYLVFVITGAAIAIIGGLSFWFISRKVSSDDVDTLVEDMYAAEEQLAQNISDIQGS